MPRTKARSFSTKFILFLLPLFCGAVGVTGIVFTAHHLLFRDPATSSTAAQLLRTLFLLLLTAVALCGAAGLLGQFWIKRQLRPIRKLQQAMRDIGQGRFDQSIDLRDAPHEIHMLAEALEEMSGCLERHVEETIENAQKAARETGTVQQTATRKIVHEIGNFLNNIDLVVYGLKPEQLSPRGEKILKILIDESGRIKGLLRRYLRFAKAPELRLQPCRIEALLAEVVEEFTPEARAADIRIQIGHSGSIPPAAIDAGQIQAVMQNLIRNSMEAIGHSGTIRIEAGLDAAHLWISVTDSGAGMDDETRKRAFEPFYTTRQNKEAVGLGLAVSRTIVEAHGGSIDCDAPIGKGAVFHIRLPVDRQPD